MRKPLSTFIFKNSDKSASVDADMLKRFGYLLVLIAIAHIDPFASSRASLNLQFSPFVHDVGMIGPFLLGVALIEGWHQLVWARRILWLCTFIVGGCFLATLYDISTAPISTDNVEDIARELRETLKREPGGGDLLSTQVEQKT